jgi:hypothetical protein
MNPIQAVLNFLRSFGKTETVNYYAPGKEPTPAPSTGPGFDQPMGQPGARGVPMEPPIKSAQQLPQTSGGGEGFRLSVPSDNGKTFNFSPELAQQIGNVFEPFKQATAAAQVLHHPTQQTRTRDEIKRLGENFNRGENPELVTQNIDISNPQTATAKRIAEGDKFNSETKKYESVDRGLFRINSRTFNGMMENPFWKAAMEKRGIKSWQDMEDPNKNTQMAYLILARSNWDSQNSQMTQNPSWNPWYAAPLKLREAVNHFQ